MHKLSPQKKKILLHVGETAAQRQSGRGSAAVTGPEQKGPSTVQNPLRQQENLTYSQDLSTGGRGSQISSRCSHTDKFPQGVWFPAPSHANWKRDPPARKSRDSHNTGSDPNRRTTANEGEWKQRNVR